MEDFLRRLKSTEIRSDYNNIRLSLWEYIKYLCCIGGIDAVFSYIFYKSVIVFVILFVPVYFYLKIIKKILIKNRKKNLKSQFKEFCLSLSSQLLAGYSLENSIHECYEDMKQLYDEESDICVELRYILQRLKFNISIENCFEDFGKRSDIEEIILFSDVITIAKRSGGNIVEVVRNAANSINQKLEVEREIEMIVNSKKYEQRIMDIVPLGMILYVNLTAPSMMNMMYETVLGRVIMTICFMLYTGAFLMGEKITDIEV